MTRKRMRERKTRKVTERKKKSLFDASFCNEILI